MHTTSRTPVERRHSPRVGVSGNALIHAATSVVRCQLVNVSTASALLRSTESAALELPVGTRVVIDLHLDAGDTRWIRLHGHVQRLVDEASLCVVFDTITPQFEDLVADEVLASLEGEHHPRALVVDADCERRTHISHALTGAGCLAVEVATPLEAILAIEQSRAHLAVVLISERAASSAGSLMSYLREVHPAIRLVTIADRALGEHDGPGWLFVNQPDLGLQVRRILAAHPIPGWVVSKRPPVAPGAIPG